MARSSLYIFALSLALSSHAFKIPQSLQYAKRDLNVLEDGVIFSGPNQDDLFVAISVGDSVVPVQLDIESSDLWIAGNLSQTDYQATSTHTSQSASPVSARIGLAGANLTHQFYYSDKAPQGWPSPPPSLDTYGRMGLGPTSDSQLVKDANDGSHSVVDQLILQEGAEPYITLLVSPLETDKGKSVSFNGFLTAGTTVDLSKIFGVSADRLAAVGVPVLSKVTNQPVLGLSGSANTFLFDDILVAGKSVGLKSTVTAGTALAKLSTTNPWMVVPKSVVDTVYAGIPGASYSTSDRLYHLPCTAEVDVTLVIAGVQYPLSSMDVIATQVGSDQCVGTFQASDGSSKDYDVLMGLPFLRNAYTLYGYMHSDGKTLSGPYYQFLPTTTKADSHALFVQVRAPAPAPTPAPVPATHTVFTTTTHTPTTTVWIGAPSGYSGPADTANDTKLLAGSLADDDTDDKNLPKGGLGDQLRHCLPAIIVLLVVMGLTAIGTTAYCIVARRRQRKFGANRPSAYKTLHTAEAAEPVHVPLYGAEEERGHMRYSDPYKDEH